MAVLCLTIGPALGDLHTEVHKPLIAWLAWHACRPGVQHVSQRPWKRQLQVCCARSAQKTSSYMPPSCLDMDEAKSEMNL